MDTFTGVFRAAWFPLCCSLWIFFVVRYNCPRKDVYRRQVPTTFTATTEGVTTGADTRGSRETTTTFPTAANTTAADSRVADRTAAAAAASSGQRDPAMMASQPNPFYRECLFVTV